MRLLKRLPLLFATILVMAGSFQAVRSADAESMGLATREFCATVTFVKGAPLLVEGTSTPRPLKKGQALYTGGTIQTDGVSRIEMALSGGGILRLAEDTTLELGSGATGASDPAVQQQLLLLKGDMWANFSGQRSGSPPQILTMGALISGPESVFRTVMYGEGDVEVKAYAGQVTASGPFEIKKESGRYSLVAARGDEGSPQETWRHQISPYHKMIVLVSGEASLPFRFAAKSDLTDWVRWNQQRDEAGE
jgi:hypothetical protein